MKPKETFIIRFNFIKNLKLLSV